MSKANLSVLMEDLRGKAGNVVFKKTKDGTIVTPRVTPSNPKTAAQVLVRGALTTSSRQWKNFATAQVTAWEAYADSNAPDYDSGINAFMKLGIKAILANGGSGTAPTTPPTTAFTGDTIKVNVTAGVGKLTFTANTANATGVATELLIQPLKSKNRKPSSGAYKSGAYVSFVTGTLSRDVIVPVGFYAAGYRFVNLATGQASNPVYLTLPGPVGLSLEDNSAGKKAKAA